MSAENVEVVRRAYEAFGRGDFDAALVAAAPDVELVSWWQRLEGDDVLAIVVTRATAQGLPVEQERGDIYTFRDGRIVRVVQNLTPAEARAQLGLG